MTQTPRISGDSVRAVVHLAYNNNNIMIEMLLPSTFLDLVEKTVPRCADIFHRFRELLLPLASQRLLSLLIHLVIQAARLGAILRRSDISVQHSCCLIRLEVHVGLAWRGR